MTTALWIGVAGFFGAISRYAVQGLVARPQGDFPWGTFVVNIGGSFLLGLLVALFAHRVAVHPDVRVAITVGFLGSFTTFSTLMLETHELEGVGLSWLAALNVLGSVAVGLLALWLGLRLGRG